MKKIISIICLAMLPFFCIAQESTTTETPATQSEVANSKEVQGYAAPTYSGTEDNSESSPYDEIIKDERMNMMVGVLSVIFLIVLWIILPKGLIHFFACLPSIAAGQGMAPKSGCGFLSVLGIAIFAAVMLSMLILRYIL